MKDTVPPPMTRTQAAIELKLLEYDEQRKQAVQLHNACPACMPEVRDQLWSCVKMYEEFYDCLRHLLEVYVQE